MNRIMKTALGLGLCLLSLPALAGDAKVGSLEVTAAWARATPPKAATGGAFMTITNKGDATDNLMGASSPVAKTVELHTHLQQGDVMRMVALGNIELQPGKSVAMAPGGLHVMLIGLKDKLVEGSTFPLELDFARAGKVTVSVDVKAIGAMGAAVMQHDPAMHDQKMKDPAYRAMHEQHMKDPAHKTMHEQMHGK
jgi:copper(I)-binding protein